MWAGQVAGNTEGRKGKIASRRFCLGRGGGGRNGKP